MCSSLISLPDIYTDIALLKEVRSSFEVDNIQIFEKVKREGYDLRNLFVKKNSHKGCVNGSHPFLV